MSNRKGETKSPPETHILFSIMEELGLTPLHPMPMVCTNSLFFHAKGRDGRLFLLKAFKPCPVGRFDPGADPGGTCQKREASFYRFLDVVDRDRCFINVPKLVLSDPEDPPKWLLFEGCQDMEPAQGKELRMDWLIDASKALQRFPVKLTFGRRGLTLERWDPYAHREVIFRMREEVEPKIGQKAWDLLCRTLNEAREWVDTQDPVLVNGCFQEENLLVDSMGRIYIHDFRRVGLGNPDHDFSWFWIYSKRNEEFKNRLFNLYVSQLDAPAKIRLEWAMRSIAIYKACLEIAEGTDVDSLKESKELLEKALLRRSLLLP